MLTLTQKGQKVSGYGSMVNQAGFVRPVRVEGVFIRDVLNATAKFQDESGAVSLVGYRLGRDVFTASWKGGDSFLLQRGTPLKLPRKASTRAETPPAPYPMDTVIPMDTLP